MAITFDTAEDLRQTLEVMRAMFGCTDLSQEKKRPMTGAERVKKCRENKKQLVDSVTECNDFETKNEEIVTSVTENCESETNCNENSQEIVTSSFIINTLKTNNSLNEEENKIKNNQENLKINEINNLNEPDCKKVMCETENETKCNEIVTVQENPVSKKQKLTPNDDAFWNVFKGEKERAQAFFKATGIYPVNKSEFGRWQKELPTFTESNISIDVMIQAIESLANSPITIAAPGSVFTTARSLANRPNIRVKPQQPEKKESFSEVAKRIQAERDSGQRSTFMDVFFGNRQKTEEQKMEIIDV